MAQVYNLAIEPLQVLIFIPTLLIFALLRRGTKQDTSRGVLLLLAAEWAMVGALFFLNVMAPVHWLGTLGGVTFLLGGLFYAGAASRSFPPHFHWRRDNPSMLSFLITAFSVIGYPGVSWALGREYPQVLTYSLMPGSVVLLTLGVLMSARPAPRLVLLLPALAIALVSPLTVILWRVWEDLAILPLALLAFAGWWRWRGKLEGAPTKDTIRFDF
ncbi:MAG: hypothetical protein HS108_01375 [Planctomycetes bacterium]|nr:hypothetical protein [Planctomycetota bacterium]